MGHDRRQIRVGRYDVVGHLADGGMAEVLLAKLSGPRGFEHPVVIKRMLEHLARRREFVDMFAAEATIAASIRHPNVVTVHELSHEDDELFLVLEYLEGESCGSLRRRLCALQEPLLPVVAAHVVAEACAGLHAAHESKDESGAPRELVHRDVSPQNLFVTYEGQVKVLDFGIAKVRSGDVTRAGELKGKLSYMSPEQAQQKPLDRRCDVFALGIVLFELVSGLRLFGRDSDLATLKAITEEPIPLPSAVYPAFPPALEAICVRALARKRHGRYPTALEMRRDLLAAQSALRAPGDPLPEEALRSLMQRVFSDRIVEKKEMLRRFRAGTALDHVPVAEVDEAVEIPIVVEEPSKLTRATFATVKDGAPVTGPTTETRRGRSLGTAVSVVAVVGLAGWAAATFLRGPASPSGEVEAATPGTTPPTNLPATNLPATTLPTPSTTTPAAPDPGDARSSPAPSPTGLASATPSADVVAPVPSIAGTVGAPRDTRAAPPFSRPTRPAATAAPTQPPAAPPASVAAPPRYEKL